jgi:hypothetical protein
MPGNPLIPGEGISAYSPSEASGYIDLVLRALPILRETPNQRKTTSYLPLLIVGPPPLKNNLVSLSANLILPNWRTNSAVALLLIAECNGGEVAHMNGNNLLGRDSVCDQLLSRFNGELRLL